jgi:hypothetical protein
MSNKRKHPAKVKHYLVTIDTFGPYRMHGYVMTDDRQNVIGVASTMAEHIEENNFRALGVVLVTELSIDGKAPDPVSIEIVRNIACDLDPRVEPLLKTVKDFHCTTWLMPKDHPSDGPLMELH